MKLYKKILTVLLSVSLIFCISGIQVSAANIEQDGLEVKLTTDKDEYSIGQPIAVTLTVKNTNDYALKNVMLQNAVPNGYKLSDKSVLTKQVEALEKDSIVYLKTTYINSVETGTEKSKETYTEENTQKQTEVINTVSIESNDTLNRSGASIDTGDIFKIFGICFSVIVAALILIFVALKKKKGKQLLSLMLISSILFCYFSIAPNNVLAAETNKVININESVKVENISVIIESVVHYQSENDDSNGYYTVTFETSGGTEVESQTIKAGGYAVKPEMPQKDGYFFAGWYSDNQFSNYFLFDEPVSQSLTLYAKWIGDNDTTDTDGDGIYDFVEYYIGTDKNKADTDGDGISDYIEIMVLATNPLEKDSDNDGLEDGEEDNDSDGLTNLEEISLGTSPVYKDTDDDGLSDYDEVKKHHTDPLKEDTDGDGVSDGKEVELGTNPLVKEEVFSFSAKSQEEDSVTASVDIKLLGEQVETLNIEKNQSEILFPDTMPGYIGSAYDFSVDGSFDKAEISFEFNQDLLQDEDFDPVIYYFNEEEQSLEPMETVVNKNKASAEVTHFSTYILLNRTVYESAFQWQDVWDSQKNYTDVEIVLVIDDSGSMVNNDMNNNRLTVAKNLIEHLPQNNKIGVVKFSSSTTLLTSSLTGDKETAKSYLTSEYFVSNGGTNMYRAITSAFSLFDTDSESTLKALVVLSDGDTWDAYMHSSTLESANNQNIKIYTVGLGNSTYYFYNYLEPLGVNSGGKFYYAANADELVEIYNDIGQKIDIETDSDSDGIPDYYEDNMIIFNGARLALDKNNPDTDGDGIRDGEELELNYKYNEDRTKVIVTGKIKSDPTSIDTDGDGLYDNAPRYIGSKIVAPRDPDPINYNGKKGMWEAHVNALKSDLIPKEYNRNENRLKLLDYLPQDVCDIIVSLIIKLDDPMVDYSFISRAVALIFRGGYLTGNVAAEMFERLTDINELDEMIGAYILNFVQDEYNIAYHSQPQTWQRKFGYNRFYDDFFDIGTKMVTTRDLRFSVNNKTYALWMWKGDYWNFHSGAEIGLYQYSAVDSYTDISLFDAIDFELPMTLSLYYYHSPSDIDNVFHWQPNDNQWWITGFRTDSDYELPWGQYMVSAGTIDFTGHEEMFNALKNSMKPRNLKYSKYFIFDEDGHTLWIMWGQKRTGYPEEDDAEGLWYTLSHIFS